MRQFIVLLALFYVCEGVTFGQLCNGNPDNEMRTSDIWGYGHYGARREDGTHTGVDIVCEDGSVVYAPFDVTLVRGLIIYLNKPERDPVNNGLMMRGEGLCVKLFYIEPDKTTGTVLKGERIGKMMRMQSVWPGMTSHVHVQLCDKSDPTSYF
ncbi:leukocyte cell-derived chemotaxin-2-like [Halichoeres trimaculatus]|uniref:leukocyte cell-derived chemotaxin-2-like n=1 Tax=Halichoeres trimaculatus TaxID=147232 RepID=UPI003D9DBB76